MPWAPPDSRGRPRRRHKRDRDLRHPPGSIAAWIGPFEQTLWGKGVGTRRLMRLEVAIFAKFWRGRIVQLANIGPRQMEEYRRFRCATLDPSHFTDQMSYLRRFFSVAIRRGERMRNPVPFEWTRLGSVRKLYGKWEADGDAVKRKKPPEAAGGG